MKNIKSILVILTLAFCFALIQSAMAEDFPKASVKKGKLLWQNGFS